MDARSDDPPKVARVLAALGNARLNGQERGNIEVFRATKSAGVDALFVTHDEWGHYYLQPALDGLGLRWTTLDYARHFTKRLSAAEWAANLRRLLAAAWAFRGIACRYRPTHIHVANPHYFLSILPALLTMRTPVVYRLGDEPTQHHVLYRVLWRRFIVPRVSRFVCVSEYVRRKAIESGVPPSKTTVIYSHPAERPPVSEAKPPTTSSLRSVVFVGQVSPHKGVDRLVEAAINLCRDTEDVQVLIAGRIARHDAFVLRLMQQVGKAGLAERIRFLGYVDDVPGLLARADVHVCPSVWEEPLSNTVVEAKLAGAPSVIFDSGGLPELIAHGRDGWICPDSTAASLEATLREVLALPEADLDAAKAAARDSLERLGITESAFANAWADVYRQTAKA